MVKEPFLINPPSQLFGGQKRHRMRKRLKVRAHARRGAFSVQRGARQHYANPFGEEVTIVGLNPFRLLGGRHARRRHHNRARHRRHRNPADMLSGVMPSVGGESFGHALPLALTGGVAVISSQVIPSIVYGKGWLSPPMPGSLPWMTYGIQVGEGLAGAYLLKKYVSKDHAMVWGVTSFSMVLADVLSKTVLPTIMGFIAPAPVAMAPAAAAAAPAGTAGVGYDGCMSELYPSYPSDNHDYGMGAFVGMGAYPQEVHGMGAYPTSDSYPL